METDVDAYFAKHDIPSVISDMLFELGFHRPKDVGKFMAAYIERRFHVADASGSASDKHGQGEGGVYEDNFSTMEIHFPARGSQESSADAEACVLLEEARVLGKKYRQFRAQPISTEDDGGPAVGDSELSSITIIPWQEFRLDYDRLLNIFTNPALWAFCERRLSVLRGLFDAHCALNQAVEEAESVANGPEGRTDTCVQLSCSLAPQRLMDFFNRKLRDKNQGSIEVAPGQTLSDLTSALNRPPMPADLVKDPDQPNVGKLGLAGVFSRTANHVRGQYLAEAVQEGFSLLEKTTVETGGAQYAQYVLPLQPEVGAWVDIARWADEFGVESDRVKWVIQLSQAAYSGLKERRSVLNFGELLDNAFGPPSASASVFVADEETEQLAALLKNVSGFELASIPGSSEDFPLADLDREPSDWTGLSNPPCSYQLYHMWARLKGLNWVREGADMPPLSLRCATSTAEPLACAYLLGINGATRCAALASHFPLQYLLALELDDLTVSVSLASKRSLGGRTSQEGTKVLSELFRAGVATALCTEDPTFSQRVDNALAAEYCLARSSLGLGEADVAEFARNSMAGSGFRAMQASDRADATDAGTIRQRYRSARRDAELKYISRMTQFVPRRGESQEQRPTVER